MPSILERGDVAVYKACLLAALTGATNVRAIHTATDLSKNYCWLLRMIGQACVKLGS